ncbi:unnamed protein product [Fusarium venenatum]|uniref:Uncharacterized protein n=1 Tax=Fusarium venenatum TaxID=56646 RepID=A0A2L2THY5_9HYPO|nr:uncharacterized protein FVRRES_04145 [Fusarium venenatum]KAH7002902.1 hypothetical protein EDB82DRAFT_469730 [Fusarium venenatum]CEI67633.1 unnamed protein product [Fusarium venenatum]
MITAYRRYIVFTFLYSVRVLGTGATCQKIIQSYYQGHSNSSQSVKHIYGTSFPGVTWDEENWLLCTTNLNQGYHQARGSVANGYLVINVAAVGLFFELNATENKEVVEPLLLVR